MLHLFCGKIAAGKSTLATRIAQDESGVLIAEDAWLSALYGDELRTGADYIRCNRKLRDAMTPHLTQLLSCNLTVVLDFQANTREVRDWMRGIIDATGSPHRLHVLSPPDAVCLARLEARNAAGTHDFTVSEAMFYQISAYFEAPDPKEGFTMVLHTDAAI